LVLASFSVQAVRSLLCSSSLSSGVVCPCAMCSSQLLVPIQRFSNQTHVHAAGHSTYCPALPCKLVRVFAVDRVWVRSRLFRVLDACAVEFGMVWSVSRACVVLVHVPGFLEQCAYCCNWYCLVLRGGRCLVLAAVTHVRVGAGGGGDVDCCVSYTVLVGLNIALIRRSSHSSALYMMRCQYVVLVLFFLAFDRVVA